MDRSSISILRQVIESPAKEEVTDLSVAGASPSSANAEITAKGTHSQPDKPQLDSRSPLELAADKQQRGASEDVASARAPVSGHAGHMKLLFDNAPVAMAMFDTQMRYLLANRRWLEDFKLQSIDIVGRSQYELFPTLHPGWRHVYERALNGQVIRSDRDAVTHDGRKTVYRWEVRPWRHVDTAVGGVMITCTPLLASNHASANAVARPTEQATENKGDRIFWENSMPMLALNELGVVMHTNPGGSQLLLPKGLEEGVTPLWRIFGEKGDQGPLRQHVLSSLRQVLSGEKSCTLVSTYPEHGAAPADMPAQWLISAIKGETIGLTGQAVLAVALVGVPAISPFSMAVSSGGYATATSSEAAAHLEELASIRRELRSITEAEQTARLRESRLRAVLDRTPCGLLVLDERARPIYHNSQVRTLLGRDLLPGQTIESWLTAEARDQVHKEEITRRWHEGVWRKQLTLALTLVTSDGLLKDIEMRPVSLPGSGVMVMMQDVTEARRSEEMLRATEAKFRTLVHENPTAVILTDHTGAVFDANPRSEDLLGRTRAELRRMTLAYWLTPESLTARAAKLRTLLEYGDRSGELEAEIIRADQSHERVLLKLAFVLDSSGQPLFTLHFLAPIPAAEEEPPPETQVDDEEPSPLIEKPVAAATISSTPLRVQEPFFAPAPEVPRPRALIDPAPESFLLEPDQELEQEVEDLNLLSPSLEEMVTPNSSASSETALVEPPVEEPFHEVDDPRMEEAESSVPESAIQASGDVYVTLLTTDVHGRIAAWSEEAQEIFGLGALQAQGRSLHTLFRPSDATGFYTELGARAAAALSGDESTWNYFHAQHGRQQGAFVMEACEEGGLAIILKSRRPQPVAIPDHTSDVAPTEFSPPTEVENATAEVAATEAEAPPPVEEEVSPPLAEEALPLSASPEPEFSSSVPVKPSLQQLDRERLLLGETHHRVKNHLQIITSMLNLQMSTMRNEEAKDALRSSQNRVRSIAALHQHLFQLTSGEAGDFRAYVASLVDHLRQCYQVSATRVRVDLDLPESTVPDAWLMPLALSLNEMVSNAFKHAYPGQEGGSMLIRLSWDENQGELLVSDDGVGVPEGFDERQTSGMGLKILRVFGGQLGGQILIDSPEGVGVEFRLVFPAKYEI